MADSLSTSYSHPNRARARNKAALAAGRTWATRILALGAFLVLLLALGFAFLVQGPDTRFRTPQPVAATALDTPPAAPPTPKPTWVPAATHASIPSARPDTSSLPNTRVRQKDGAQMVYVPAGAFWMGCDENDPKARPFASPRHKLRVDAFWIDRTEVTNAQYRQCVIAGECGPPQKTSSASITHYYDNPKYDDYPVVNVTWHQAHAYARWVGGRLPTEAEWEYAARGPEGSTYPWGADVPNAELLNYNFEVDESTPVGSYPEGASWCGALDMSGNVWEWTSSLFYPYPYDATDGRESTETAGRRVLRGGAFVGDAEHVQSTIRAWPAPGYWDWLCGFRVVVTSPE